MLSKITPSYLYQEYNDDDNLQAFVRAQNELAQSYLDWFGGTYLPDYTSVNVSSTLLDWVAEGLYGEARPVLPYGVQPTRGPYNTWAYDQFAFNTLTYPFVETGGLGVSFYVGISPIGGTSFTGENTYISTDDTFKRCLTWNQYKGDGKTFNVRWLKRRVSRFLNGINGVDPPVTTTYDISVIFGKGNLVNIILLGGTVTPPLDAAYDRMVYNRVAFNGGNPIYSGTRGRLLRAALLSGVLQSPFQNRYEVYG